MASSLFGGASKPAYPSRQKNDFASAVNEVRRQIGNKNPVAVLNEICANDPQAKAFVDSMRSKSPMEIAAQFFK